MKIPIRTAEQMISNRMNCMNIIDLYYHSFKVFNMIYDDHHCSVPSNPRRLFEIRQVVLIAVEYILFEFR